MKKQSFFSRQDIGLAYIAPWFVGFLAFTLIPMVVSFYYSLGTFNTIDSFHFVGFSHYRAMFSDLDFSTSLKATFIFVFFSVPIKLISALLFAVLLNRKLKAINFYRTLFYLPSILIGSVAIGILWRLMFAKEGLINHFLGFFGVVPQNWLGNPKTTIFVLCLLPIWQFGSSMVIFLAALKQIPQYLYEAARIDGASRVRQFFTITFPLISPVTLFNLIMQTINAFQEFSAPYVITGGGPAKTTYLYSLMIYDRAFQSLRMGYASALSWFLFAIILLFTLLLFRTSSQWTFYEDGKGLV